MNDDDSKEWDDLIDQQVIVVVLAQLKLSRLAAHLTEEAVAARISMTPTDYRKLEDGESDPRMSTLQRAFRATGSAIQVKLMLPPDVASRPAPPAAAADQEQG